ncbi:Replicative DNA helicase [compost metagenome]
MHLEEHLQILLQHYYAREQIALYQEKMGELYAFQDPENIAIEVSRRLIDIQKRSDSNLYTMKQLALQSINEREANISNPKELGGLPSGIRELDKATNGFKEPELTIIAGRPAMGKTAVVLSVAKATATQGDPVVVFSLEMAAMQLYKRIQSNETQINGMRIRTLKLSAYELDSLNKADQYLADLPIYIDDTASLNIDKLRMLIAIYIQLYGIKLVVVDYLQLLEAEVNRFGASNSAIGQVSRKLKIFAKEFNIPIIALAQLSRAVESRTATGCKPMLADLRESGNIEQDADNVIFLWRPEYYEILQEIPIRGYVDPFSYKNLLVFIIAKIREGETRSIPAYADLSTMTIKDHPDVITEDQTEMPF